MKIDFFFIDLKILTIWNSNQNQIFKYYYIIILFIILVIYKICVQKKKLIRLTWFMTNIWEKII